MGSDKESRASPDPSGTPRARGGPRSRSCRPSPGWLAGSGPDGAGADELPPEPPFRPACCLAHAALVGRSLPQPPDVSHKCAFGQGCLRPHLHVAQNMTFEVTMAAAAGCAGKQAPNA